MLGKGSESMMKPACSRQMAIILQTAFSNAFSCRKIVHLAFGWGDGLAMNRQKDSTWANDGHMVSPVAPFTNMV